MNKFLLLLLLSYANSIQIDNCNEVWTSASNNLYSMKFYACLEPIQQIVSSNIINITHNISTTHNTSITHNTSKQPNSLPAESKVES